MTVRGDCSTTSRGSGVLVRRNRETATGSDGSTDWRRACPLHPRHVAQLCPHTGATTPPPAPITRNGRNTHPRQTAIMQEPWGIITSTLPLLKRIAGPEVTRNS